MAFLHGLVAGGLTGIQLINSDAHAALVEAIGSTLTGSGWQQCRPPLSGPPARLRPPAVDHAGVGAPFRWR
ncbi:transposase [Actinomadura sp. K4S16]|uniref:transposase n=1 Tax=Actinomadura sp. K4S16 TaxID=1316147 RepID=UPI0011ECF018